MIKSNNVLLLLPGKGRQIMGLISDQKVLDGYIGFVY